MMSFLVINVIYLHNFCSSFHLPKKHHNHYGANHGLIDKKNLLPTTKPRNPKGVCNYAIILEYFSVFTYKNKRFRCMCVWGH